MIYIRSRRKLASWGEVIKIRLIEKGITQAEFCRRNKINYQMFSDMLHTERYPKLRKYVLRKLGVKESA